MVGKPDVSVKPFHLQWYHSYHEDEDCSFSQNHSINPAGTVSHLRRPHLKTGVFLTEIMLRVIVWNRLHIFKLLPLTALSLWVTVYLIMTTHSSDADSTLQNSPFVVVRCRRGDGTFGEREQVAPTEIRYVHTTGKLASELTPFLLHPTPIIHWKFSETCGVSWAHMCLQLSAVTIHKANTHAAALIRLIQGDFCTALRCLQGQWFTAQY
jgi:hypothetical protein